MNFTLRWIKPVENGLVHPCKPEPRIPIHLENGLNRENDKNLTINDKKVLTYKISDGILQLSINIKYLILNRKHRNTTTCVTVVIGNSGIGNSGIGNSGI